jgi:hypothetical protein
MSDPDLAALYKVVQTVPCQGFINLLLLLLLLSPPGNISSQNTERSSCSLLKFVYKVVTFLVGGWFMKCDASVIYATDFLLNSYLPL